MKIVVSDPENGETYQKEIEEDEAKALHRKRIGQEIQGSLIDLGGYTLEITGGSDKQGFPMRKGVNTQERKKLLLEGGTGYKPQEKGMKKRKTVRGEIVSEEVEQLNLKVKSKGRKKLEVLFGLEEPEETEEEEVEEEKEEMEVEQEETEEEAEKQEQEEEETEEQEEEEGTEEQEETEEEEVEEETEEEQEEQEEEKEDEEKVECPECGKEFDSEKGMKIHKSQSH